ncbi:MAG: glycosyltransferase family 2 protein [Candidatus Methanoperedens sp.]|nr:glycosyltransferase family 2 protein [Candidatus Methanoperedens sp.]
MSDKITVVIPVKYEELTVSVIIPNYNGKHYLEDCLSSLSNQSYRNYEVVIVDNASTDGSIEYIKNNFPQFKIIENSENLGFAKAVNQAAKNTKNDFIAVLNNDTEVHYNWLEEFIIFSKSYEDFGSCQSKILLYDRKDTINTVGNELFFLGHGWSGRYGKPDMSDNNVMEVSYCSGASMFMKREVFEQAGYFDDEEVFMYHDDLDLGWRLLLLGYKNYVAPKSIAYHKYQYSRNNKKYYYLEVSRFVSIIKYYQLKTMILILPAFLILEAGIILLSIRGGWLQDKIKVYWYILKNFYRLLQKRDRIQKQRKLPDRDISKYFKGKVEFQEFKNIYLQLINPFFDAYWKITKKVI